MPGRINLGNDGFPQVQRSSFYLTNHLCESLLNEPCNELHSAFTAGRHRRARWHTDMCPHLDGSRGFL